MTGRIRIGYEPDFAPLTYREDGAAQGLIIDILNRAFDRLGYGADFVPVALPDQDDAIRVGEIDALAFKAAISERAAAFDFSTPLAISGAAWFAEVDIRPGNRPEHGSRLATPGAGPLLAELRRRYPDLVFVDVDTYAEALDAVVGGMADTAALNFHVGRFLAARDHAGRFVLPVAPFEKLPLALAVSKGAHASLLVDFNAALSGLQAEGALSAIEARRIPA